MNKSIGMKLKGVITPLIARAVVAEKTGDGRLGLKLNLSNEEFIILLRFLVLKGLDPDSAMKVINTVKNEQFQLRAEIIRKGGPYSYAGTSDNLGWLYLLFVVFMVGFTALAVIKILPVWALPLVYLFGFGMIWLLWAPKAAVKNALIADREIPLAERLEKLYVIEQEPLLSHMMQYMPKRFIAFVLAAVLCIGGTSGMVVVSQVQAINYHRGITSEYDPLLEMHEGGSRFVVYNADSGWYMNKGYLTDDQLARTSSEVAGVLKMKTRTEIVGSYSNGGDALRYVASIEMYDCASGEVVGRESVKGSMPPMRIVRKGLSILFNKDGHGNKPDDEDIERACQRLVKQYYDAGLNME